MLITTLRQLDVQEQLPRQFLPGTKQREKDIINDTGIQLLTDLLPEELLHETRDHYLFLLFFVKSIIKNYIKFTNE
jgi:hypothetical protein